MADAFISLLSRNQEYDQVRWIDEHGIERVRINRTGSGVEVVPEGNLQNKSSSYFVINGARLKAGEIFISPIDLNVDEGKISIPYRPTLRMVAPIFNRDGVRRGMLVINVLAGPLLDALKKTGNPKDRHVMLLNQDGYWLAAPNPADEWGFMLNRSISFGSRMPQIWSRIVQAPQGQVFVGKDLWTWETVTPPTERAITVGDVNVPKWIIVSHPSSEIVETIYTDVWPPVVLSAAFLLAAFAAFSWQLAARTKSDIESLSARIRAETAEEEGKQKLAELEQIVAMKETLAAIVESTQDAIVAKRLDGTVLSWNAGAENLFGYAASEAIGKNIRMLLPPGFEKEEDHIIEQISRGENIGHFETLRRHKEGHLIDVSVAASPIRNSMGMVVGVSKIAHDITESKRVKAELMQHREHLEELVRERTQQLDAVVNQLKLRERFITTVTDNIPGLIGYWDQQQRCQFANSAYFDWFGITSEKMLGMTVNQVLGDEQYQKIAATIQAVLAGVPQQYSLKIMKQSGEIAHGLANYIPDRNGDDVVGFFSLITDITPLKVIEGELRKANESLGDALEKAREAGMIKSQFLANMSHEIRTPMNAVLGFLSLVLEGETLSNTAHRQLTTAHNAAKSLLILINDILDISKLQSGKFDLEKINFNLPKVIHSALEVLRLKVLDKKLALRVHYSKTLTHCFAGDPFRVQQILTNLVGNAIKFTETGYIEINVEQGNASDMISISVTDTGIGMRADEIARIFTPFVQGDSTTTRRFGGTGLGVSICKQLAEAMGGEISVESQLGVGSCFRVSLRLEPLSSETECHDHALIAGDSFQSLRRFHVLLVDDIEENLELGEARLTGQMHRVTIARNGQEALKLATEQVFDLILMDVHMPEMNGLDATRAIRQACRECAYQVPIIALTASVLPAQQQQCFEAGMNAFIGKPIEFGALFRLMESIVPAERGEVIDAVVLPNYVEQTNHLPDTDGIDWADGMRRWNDAHLYVQALVKFFHKNHDVVDRLRLFCGQGDWSAAYQLVHALKGVAGNLALADIARIANLLNEAFKFERSVERSSDSLSTDHSVAPRMFNSEQLIAELDAAMQVAAVTLHELEQRHQTNLSMKQVDIVDAPILATLDELLRALASDDPSVVEPVLARLDTVVPANDVIRLKRLVEEFEFESARRLVADLTENGTLN